MFFKKTPSKSFAIFMEYLVRASEKYELELYRQDDFEFSEVILRFFNRSKNMGYSRHVDFYTLMYCTDPLDFAECVFKEALEELEIKGE